MKDAFRLEILLPIYHNPDEKGNREKIDGTELIDTYEELMNQFGGCSQHDPIHGSWINPETHENITDELNVLCVVFDDTDENREFLKDYKEKLKVRFKQDEIFMTITHTTIL